MEVYENKQILKKYTVIVFGAAVFAAGFQFFTFPNDIVSGGTNGVAMIGNRLTGLPVGFLGICINVPLFLYAWRHFGLGFIVSSLVGMGASSLFIDMLSWTGFVATTDPMLAAIMGSVLKGFGLGVIYYVGATTGGIDIVSKLIRQKNENLNFGTILMIVDASIIVVYAMILNRYECVMYSVIGTFVLSKVVDIKRVVRKLDARAFVIVTEAKNVFGNRFDDISEVR